MTKYKSDAAAFIWIIFFAIGVIMLGAMVFMKADFEKFKKTAVPTAATITDIERYRTHHGRSNSTDHTVYIEYEYGGRIYDDTLGYYVAGMHEGDTVQIYVDPQHPGNFKSESKIVYIIFLVFGLVFGGVGGVCLVGDIRKRIKVNDLIARDCYVWCDRWEEIPGNVRVNNVRYHCIRAYYDNGYKTLRFDSRSFHPNKTPLVPGQNVRVFVDQSDPTMYYVDIDV